ncbi:insulin-like growth factor-binding protein 7 [Ptychodera flava]|uniref:insulin-like growth factor-binding protein 7 n=1 Tax=Ptychodera flava TaxID=63121 RepID=UPI00396A2E59
MKVFLVFVLASLCLGAPQEGSEADGECPPCKKEDCQLRNNCMAYAKDDCGCCFVCLRSEQEACGGENWDTGKCREGLDCYINPEKEDQTEGTCICVEDSDNLCGSDDVDYKSICHLQWANKKLEKDGKPGNIEVKSKGYCKRAPTIKTPNTTLDHIAGSEMYLFCKSHGVPTPKMAWFQGDEELPGDNENVQLQLIRGNERNEMIAYLIFIELRPIDAGEYTCTATNSEGDAKETITLNVAQNYKTEL